MRQLTKYAYEGHDIQFDVVDGKVMANATAMCKVFGKKPSHWLELEAAKKYIKAIARKNGISDNQLVTTKPGSTENGGGTWINESLLLRLAGWLNIDFEIWMDERIAELLRTGKTELTPSLPSDYKQAVKALLAQIELNEKVEERLLEVQPKVDFYDVAANSYGVFLWREAAKRIGMQQGTIIQFCKDKNLINESLEPYQWVVSSGYLKVILGTRKRSNGSTEVTSTTKVTVKGLQYINKLKQAA